MQASRHTSCLQKGVIEISWNQRFRERTKEFLEQTGHIVGISVCCKLNILSTIKLPTNLVRREGGRKRKLNSGGVSTRIKTQQYTVY